MWLEPQARDWILVGLTEDTAAYRTISHNMQSAADAGLEEGYGTDGRVAFFAKGAIKGEYLLTAAYDSSRDHEVAKDSLLGVVEPDRFYTLYGDATEQRFEAATSRKLFVKLERRQFAALFGDFETGLTLTELSRYSRTFTGLKSDYAGERFGYSAFAAESEQGYVKDELQGDGTSGLYRLSRRPMILNSDKIRLELRDRFRSEVVVESRPLSPFVDYSIDYLNGTLFFKQPVPSRDQDFNPVFIIAEYEVLNGGEAQMTAGGRAAVKLATTASRSVRATCRRARRRATAGSPARICVGRSAPRPSCARKWRAVSRTIRCGLRAPMPISRKSCTSANGSTRAPTCASRRRDSAWASKRAAKLARARSVSTAAIA